MLLLIKNGRVLDPDSGTDEVLDVLVEDGVIRKIGKNLRLRDDERSRGGNEKYPAGAKAGQLAGALEDALREDEDARYIDASGCWVMPGLIDLHVHLRDPGLTYKEDIETGGKAAAAGGVTTVFAMPNTKPVIDTPDKYNYVRFKAAAVSPVHVEQIGSVTMGQKGEELTDFEAMADAGVRAFSEDGKSVMNARLMRDAFRRCRKLDIPIFDHCEDKNLAKGGVMNDDENAVRLGLMGIPNSAEDLIALRDMYLAKDTGAQLHLCHVSTKSSVDLIRIAKKEGVRVTAEVCPHHFALTSDDILRDDPNFKMNPPLRTKADRDALIEGLKDGTIDCISTDHAPHSASEKAGSFRTAANGIVGLETSYSLAVTKLVDTGILTPLDLVKVMSTNPAKIAHLPLRGRLQEGMQADITIADPEKEYVIDKSRFFSKGKNTPFDGWKVRGKVRMTIVDGEVVYEEGGLEL